MRAKEVIRQEVWELLEASKVARFPGAKGRIPNFIGAEACVKLLAHRPWWKQANTIKANPDLPQRAIRH